jgi:xanthine dehydrogenase YagS FAD-binding subunit
MSGNLCRCGAYPNIVDAIESVIAGQGAGSPGGRGMNRFGYVRADDLGGAVRALAADPTAKVIAGGTNLVDLMKYDVERPGTLVDVTRIPGLDRIEEADGGLVIGALVSNTALADDPRIAQRYPLLASAVLAGRRASCATRRPPAATSTTHPLLLLLRRGHPLQQARARLGLPAIHGVQPDPCDPRQSEHCIATHPSDLCVALAALEAVVRVAGPRASADPLRRVPPPAGDRPEVDNTLRAGEIVTAVELPAAAGAFAEHHTYLKLRDRLSYAFALVSVAAGLEMDGGVIRLARIALGGVAHKPWRRADAEDRLAGRAPDRAAFAEAADLLLEGAAGLRAQRRSRSTSPAGRSRGRWPGRGRHAPVSSRQAHPLREPP